MKANELEEYSAKELDRLAREREQAIKAKGGLPYVDTRPVGESKLLLLAKLPTDNPDKDGRPRKARKAVVLNDSDLQMARISGSDRSFLLALENSLSSKSPNKARKRRGQ